VFADEHGIGVDGAELDGQVMVYDPVLGSFLFDKNSVVSKSRAVNALRDFGRQKEAEVWREETMDVAGRDVKIDDVAIALRDDAEAMRKLEDCLG